MHTLQVFGRLIKTAEGAGHGIEGREVCSGPLASAEPQERNNDLREHMVGILFSRSKLTHLQKQVRVYVCMCLYDTQVLVPVALVVSLLPIIYSSTPTHIKYIFSIQFNFPHLAPIGILILEMLQ